MNADQVLSNIKKLVDKELNISPLNQNLNIIYKMINKYEVEQIEEAEREARYYEEEEDGA